MTPDGRFIGFIGSLTGATTPNLYIWDTQLSRRVYTNTTTGIGSVALSPDGNRVAYATSTDLSIVDRTANITKSVGATLHHNGKFSTDGQFFAFTSSHAQGFSDTNGTWDIYIYDWRSDAKTLVSRAYNSISAANAASDVPTISADGRFVAYRSSASNIIPSATNGWPNLFLYDRTTGTNTLLSISHNGTSSGNYWCLAPAFSGNGRVLVFPSWASDLVDRDLNSGGDLFAFTFLYVNIVRTAGSAVISWPSASGQSYQVQFKNNADDPDWENLPGTIVFSGDTGYLEDVSSASAHRFYRVVAF
jgi:hypothetical protein